MPSTDPMGLPPSGSGLGEEDTLVREHAYGQTDPYASIPRPSARGRTEPPPPARSGTDPSAPGTEGEAHTTDPYAQALPRGTPPPGSLQIS